MNVHWKHVEMPRLLWSDCEIEPNAERKRTRLPQGIWPRRKVDLLSCVLNPPKHTDMVDVSQKHFRRICESFSSVVGMAIDWFQPKSWALARIWDQFGQTGIIFWTAKLRRLKLRVWGGQFTQQRTHQRNSNVFHLGYGCLLCLACSGWAYDISGGSDRAIIADQPCWSDDQVECFAVGHSSVVNLHLSCGIGNCVAWGSTEARGKNGQKGNFGGLQGVWSSAHRIRSHPKKLSVSPCTSFVSHHPSYPPLSFSISHVTNVLPSLSHL